MTDKVGSCPDTRHPHKRTDVALKRSEAIAYGPPFPAGGPVLWPGNSVSSCRRSEKCHQRASVKAHGENVLREDRGNDVAMDIRQSSINT